MYPTHASPDLIEAVTHSLDDIRRLNYDHHERMNSDAAANDTERTKEIIRLDDESYRSLLTGIPSSTSLLEIGSANGRQWTTLGTWAFDLTGLDLYEPDVLAGRNAGRNIVLGYAEELPFPDASFDIVCSRHVMEHVADVPKVFSEVMRVLRPGGYVAAITPHYFPDPEPAHINQYPLDEWRKLYRAAGYEIIKAELGQFNCTEAHIVARKPA